MVSKSPEEQLMVAGNYQTVDPKIESTKQISSKLCYVVSI